LQVVTLFDLIMPLGAKSIAATFYISQ